MNNKSFEIQNQIRQNALQVNDNIKGLKQWELEMKEKETEMLRKKQEEENSSNLNHVSLFQN